MLGMWTAWEIVRLFEPKSGELFLIDGSRVTRVEAD